MHILLNLDLEERQIEQIRTVTDKVELIRTRSQEETLEAMPEVEVVFGGFSRDMFQRAPRLRWVQTTGAGVDGILFPEFVESKVILTSAKGTVGVHLAEHAMALLLGLTRGIAWAVRKPDWEQRMPIRYGSWELIDRKMRIVGLGAQDRTWRCAPMDSECGFWQSIQSRWKRPTAWKSAGEWIASTICWPQQM